MVILVISSGKLECHWEKMTQDFQALITPKQIREFERSKASKDAISLLGQLASAHNIVLTQTQYTLICDFLLVETSIDNTNRAGSLANIALGEFTSMSKQNDDYVVPVIKSKTGPWPSKDRFELKVKKLVKHLPLGGTSTSYWIK